MVDGKDRDKAAKRAHEGKKKIDEPEPKPSKPKIKKQSTDSTTVHVDKEEMDRADAILEILEKDKGPVIRMLRINRGSVLRMAVAEGLDVLEDKVSEGTLL